MKAYAVIALCVVMAAGWTINRFVVAPLKAEIRQAQADLERAREAQRVADAYVLGAERREADLNGRIEAALTGTYGGCADAPIDPALLRAVNGL